MAATPTGHGYWEVAADGGIFTFGNAQFYGSASGMNLGAAVSSMALTPTGGGYWIMAANGAVASFGDAQPEGGATKLSLKGPIVAAVGT